MYAQGILPLDIVSVTGTVSVPEELQCTAVWLVWFLSFCFVCHSLQCLTLLVFFF